ncbi:MAG TPA: hypothetical protein VLV86_08810 [Vicinamibacterales bacterium]|nr:hypothetical protein [Vicinamibacterales bacterium]
MTNLVCGFGVVACSWLAVMFVVLHRPGFERGVATALLFVLQSLLALVVLNSIRSSVWGAVALAGAAGIVWAGGRAVAATLGNPHFEGFILIIGSALVLQGILTAQQLITRYFTSSSKVHQFGR